MAQKQLTIETLPLLDYGSAGAICNAAIKEALADLDDRGKEDRKSRIVEIRLELFLKQNGEVDASVQAGVKLPKRRTATTTCAVRQDGKGEHNVKVLFSEWAPDEPAQLTIDTALEVKRDVDEE